MPGAEIVELAANLVGQHGKIAGVDADTAQARAGDLDRVGHTRGDVIGVDQQRGVRPERVHLCAERGTFPVRRRPRARPRTGPLCSIVNACELVPSAGTP